MQGVVGSTGANIFVFLHGPLYTKALATDRYCQASVRARQETFSGGTTYLGIFCTWLDGFVGANRGGEKSPTVARRRGHTLLAQTGLALFDHDEPLGAMNGFPQPVPASVAPPRLAESSSPFECAVNSREQLTRTVSCSSFHVHQKATRNHGRKHIHALSPRAPVTGIGADARSHSANNRVRRPERQHIAEI